LHGREDRERLLVEKLTEAQSILDECVRLVECPVCSRHIDEVSQLTGELVKLSEFAHDTRRPETLRFMRKVIKVGDDLRLFNLLVKLARFFNGR
jgi:hypothetical protein